MSEKSGAPVKMEIIGYKDERFSKECGSIRVQINPSTLKYEKKTKFSGGRNTGTSAPAKNFDKLAETSLSFDFIFDETGVVPLRLGDKDKTIPEIIDHLESVVYNINSETHQPNFLKLSWGCFIFKGRLTALNHYYTLFRPDGSPLRVKVSITITGWLDPLSEAKQVGRQSPDLTRLVTLADGETLELLCEQIYGDSSYCVDVARENGMAGFRHIEPGTEIVFPPLKRSDGRFTR